MHVAERTDTITLLLSRFLSVMVGWVALSVHVADSYRSGGGQGAAGTLPERRLCLYGCGGHYLGSNGCVKGSRTGLRDSYYETKETLSLMVFKF